MGPKEGPKERGPKKGAHVHEQIQGFLETQISAKSQGLKTSWSCFAKFLKFGAKSSKVVALTFRCGSRRGSPGIDFPKGSSVLDLRKY